MKESKIREILISYQKKRDKAESDLELRKNDVYSQIPEFKKLDDEISKVGLQLAKLVLQNPSNRENIILESKKKMDELKKHKFAYYEATKDIDVYSKEYLNDFLNNFN